MLAAAGFVSGFCEVRSRFSQLGLRIKYRYVKRRSIYTQQQIASVDELIIFNREPGNAAGNLGRNAHLLRANFAVASPWGLHVVVPQPPSCQHRDDGDRNC